MVGTFRQAAQHPDLKPEAVWCHGVASVPVMRAAAQCCT